MYIEDKLEEKIIIFTGAGLSSESGISTFRYSNGLWENYNIEDVCTESTWMRNFELVHKFYNERRSQLSSVEPNAAHYKIAELEKKYGDKLIVITQNIDDLLERAGVKNVLHVHGELTKMYCVECYHKWDQGYKDSDGICPKCGEKTARPNVVFFGGAAPMYKYMKRAFFKINHKDSKMIVIGTLGNVVPVQSYIGTIVKSEWVKNVKGKTFLNNLERSEYLSENLFDEIFYGKATEAIDGIDSFLAQED